MPTPLNIVVSGHPSSDRWNAIHLHNSLAELVSTKFSSQLLWKRYHLGNGAARGFGGWSERTRWVSIYSRERSRLVESLWGQGLSLPACYGRCLNLTEFRNDDSFPGRLKLSNFTWWDSRLCSIDSWRYFKIFLLMRNLKQNEREVERKKKGHRKHLCPIDLTPPDQDQS